MHILLFYQYYHNLDCPASGRHYAFIKALSERHQVTILTSDIWEKKRITHLFDWIPPGVTLHSFPVPYENAMSVKDRIKAFAGYAIHAIQKGLFVSKPDVILGSSTPLTAAWAAASVARIRNIPWIFEVRDLWPDFPIQMGAISSKWAQRRLYNLERSLYKSASHIITLSPDMERHVRSKGIPKRKVTTLLNGTDIDLANQVSESYVDSLRVRYGLQNKKIILYAGTFGRANAIPILAQLVKRLQQRDDIHFLFMGEGYYKGLLEDAAKDSTNLTVLPPEPRHKIFYWFKLADLSLVSFNDLPVLQANSPAKFFDSLAVGTPVLVTNPGWTKDFVETHGCGWYAPIQELDSLVSCIDTALNAPHYRKEAGLRGQRVARTYFDRDQMVDILQDILLAQTRPVMSNALITAQ